MSANYAITPIKAQLNVAVRRPYITFTTGNQQVSTAVGTPTYNGIKFNDIVEVNLNGTEETVNVNVFDQDDYGNGNYVAHTRIPIYELTGSEDGEGEYNLFNKTGNVGKIFVEWLKSAYVPPNRQQLVQNNRTQTNSYYPELEQRTSFVPTQRAAPVVAQSGYYQPRRDVAYGNAVPHRHLQNSNPVRDGYDGYYSYQNSIVGADAQGRPLKGFTKARREAAKPNGGWFC